MYTPRILVVDDESDVVQLIDRMLAAEQFEVICAYDGISAVDIAETEKPDLILLDIMMPMMSGYEVCRQVRANPQTKNIPVLFMSSGHSMDVRSQSQKAGANTLILKPFSPAELLAQVRRYLPKREENTVAGA